MIGQAQMWLDEAQKLRARAAELEAEAAALMPVHVVDVGVTPTKTAGLCAVAGDWSEPGS